MGEGIFGEYRCFSHMANELILKRQVAVSLVNEEGGDKKETHYWESKEITFKEVNVKEDVNNSIKHLEART